MASKLPANQAYVDRVKQLTIERLSWLINELRGSEFELAIDKFEQFKAELLDIELNDFAQPSAYPTLPMFRSPLGEWEYCTNPVKREQRCRIANYHQAYQDVVRKLGLYSKYRIKKNKQTKTQPEIEEDITEQLKPRKVRRGYKRHPIFFWTGKFID